MAWPTPNQVVNGAARELALISSDVSNVFTSTDKNIMLLGDLLNLLGQTLARQHPWSQLQREATVATIASAPSYAIPAGFLRLIDGTAWNRTQQLPPGISNPQDWQMLKAQTSGGLTSKVVRILGGALHLYETPTAAETFAYEYQSAYWVRDTIAAWATSTAYVEDALVYNYQGYVYACTDAGTSGGTPLSGTGVASDGVCSWIYLYPSTMAAPGTAESTDTSTDYLLFDYRLLVDGLKLEFMRRKGMDTTVAQQAYDATLSAMLGGDGFGAVLTLNGGRRFPYITPWNAPEGGYG